MTKLMMVVGLLGLGIACGAEPCQDYVDYMCDCHGEDTGFDCNELQRVYADADASVQQQCQLELSDQQDQDDADGETCAL